VKVLQKNFAQVRLLQSRYADDVTENFLLPCRAICSDLKTIFILGFEVKKGDRLRVQPKGCRLQSEGNTMKPPG
jgi:hypothetical protein